MKILIAIALFFASSVAQAQEVATVVRVEPKFVTVHQRQCQQMSVTEDNSGLGTVIGGVAGGIIGHQVGKGTGKDVATVLGAVTGAAVGNRIGQDQRNSDLREVCSMIPVQMQRGRVVTFNYQGQIFSVQFDR